MKKIRASVLGLVVSLGMFPTPVTRAPFTITVTGVVRSTTCPTEEQCFDVNWTAKPPIEVTITGWTVTLNLTDAAWREAQFGKDLGKYSFREWAIPFQPQRAGAYELKVKATNRIGQSQPMEPLWKPAGYMRNVVETVKVTAA